jgi:hypothetical protein
LPVPIVRVPGLWKASAFVAAQSAAVAGPVAPVPVVPVLPIVGSSSAHAANSKDPATSKANVLRIE